MTHTIAEAIAILEDTPITQLIPPHHRAWYDYIYIARQWPETRCCPLMTLACHWHSDEDVVDIASVIFDRLKADLDLSQESIDRLTYIYDHAGSRDRGKRRVIDALRELT